MKTARESDETLAVAPPRVAWRRSPRGKIVFNAVAITKRIYGFNELFLLGPGVESESGYEPERTAAHPRRARARAGREPRRHAGRLHRKPPRHHHADDRRLDAEGRAHGRACSRAERALRAGLHAAFLTRRQEGGLQRVDRGRLPRHPPGRRRHRAVRPDHARPRHGLGAELLARRQADLLRVRSHLRHPQHLRLRTREQKLWQVTNVRTGALFPEVSTDGKTLVYVGYTSYGYDLYAMALDRARFVEAAPYVDTRPDSPVSMPVAGSEESWPSVITSRHPYNPLPTLRPRSWDFNYGPGSFGAAISVTTSASDVVGHHAISAALLVETEHSDPQGGISYAYGRLPFDFRVGAYRALTPINLGSDRPLFIRQTVGVSSGVSYALPTEFEGHGFAFSYSLSRFDGALPLAPAPDPYAPVRVDPPRGQIGSIHMGWSFANAEGYLNSVGPERGFTLALTADIAAPLLGSDYNLYVFGYTATDFFPCRGDTTTRSPCTDLPRSRWGTIRTRASSMSGVFWRPRSFRTTRSAPPGPFVLRGYPAFSIAGNQYHLINAEYRFPIVDVDRGYSTLPVFLGRISGNFFADYGGAFDQLDQTKWTEQFHLGVGGELWVDLTLGLLPYGPVSLWVRARRERSPRGARWAELVVISRRFEQQLGQGR